MVRDLGAGANNGSNVMYALPAFLSDSRLLVQLPVVELLCMASHLSWSPGHYQVP